MESQDFIKVSKSLLLESSSTEPVTSDVMTQERNSCLLMKRKPASYLNSFSPSSLLDSLESSHIPLIPLEGD